MLKNEATESEIQRGKDAESSVSVSVKNPEDVSSKSGFRKLFCAEKAKIIPAETSRRITALRFLLIVLVVFIHNNF